MSLDIIIIYRMCMGGPRWHAIFDVLIDCDDVISSCQRFSMKTQNVIRIRILRNMRGRIIVYKLLNNLYAVDIDHSIFGKTQHSKYS